MTFSSICFAVFLSLSIIVAVNAQDIDMGGQFMCNMRPNNQLTMELIAYDRNTISKRLHAIDDDHQIMDGCVVGGTGTLGSPYTVTTTIDLGTDQYVNNNCNMSMTTTGGSKFYNWVFMAYSYGADEFFYTKRNFIMFVSCDANVDSGTVSTVIELDVTRFEVEAANPSDITGVNAVALNANIIYNVVIYPGSNSLPQAVRGAAGIYLYSCGSSTSQNMDENYEMFIDTNGCPIADTDYVPTNGGFIEDSNTGTLIKLSSQYGTATVINGEKTIYMQCYLGVCLTSNDAFCINRCAAHADGQTTSSVRINTGSTISTTFVVQDILGQEMFPARPNGNPRIESTNINAPISIVAQNSPNGIGAPSVISDALGFYVYNCRYSLSEDMANPQTFVNSAGCRVSGTNMVLRSEIEFDPDESSINQYVLQSGIIDLDGFSGNNRIWVKCSTGKCTVNNHNYCIGTRCGAADNIPGGSQDLGDQGLSFTLSLIDPANVPATQLQVSGPDGDIIQTNDVVNVGTEVDFNVEVTPGGLGSGTNSFDDARGIFIYDCVAVSDGVSDQFLDDNGCQVPGSRFQLNKKCLETTAMAGVPPFKVNCGSYVVPFEGDIQTTCQVGYCLSKNNNLCRDRCAAGEIIGTPADHEISIPGLSVQAAYTSEIEDTGRTAERSEEIDDIVTAVTTVLAIFVLLVVVIGTICIMQKQKAKARKYGR